MSAVTLEALVERVDGCQEREDAERQRVHARLSSLEEVTRNMASDLTFLRGRMSGWWGILLFLAAAGGVTGGVVAVVKAAGG